MAVTGRVSLVGAGPGDPGLLTRRAIARLRAADLVFYDALINERILRYARKAQRFFVGKRAGRHAMTQDAIHRLLIRGARRGKHVVRLKGGDPFVFGRGGEEALALQRAGIPYDIVPGISSAIAAPAAAGIPVTHRGVSPAFLVVSAHDEATFNAATQGIPPNRITLVVLMGLARSAAIACRLIDTCWSRRTPVAVITDATTIKQHIWRGTLDDLAEDRFVADSRSAGTIVIGDVVSLGLGQTVVARGWSAEAVANVAGTPARTSRRGFGGLNLQG
jgi:uroporphyrin-III C-methyltransferase/precorrin-2 dehydrogenase/sirohydrochlorin ferrochelatase